MGEWLNIVPVKLKETWKICSTNISFLEVEYERKQEGLIDLNTVCVQIYF